jgi:hypothetical protein
MVITQCDDSHTLTILNSYGNDSGSWGKDGYIYLEEKYISFLNIERIIAICLKEKGVRYQGVRSTDATFIEGSIDLLKSTTKTWKEQSVFRTDRLERLLKKIAHQSEITKPKHNTDFNTIQAAQALQDMGMTEHPESQKWKVKHRNGEFQYYQYKDGIEKWHDYLDPSRKKRICEYKTNPISNRNEQYCVYKVPIVEWNQASENLNKISIKDETGNYIEWFPPNNGNPENWEVVFVKNDDKFRYYYKNKHTQALVLYKYETPAEVANDVAAKVPVATQPTEVHATQPADGAKVPVATPQPAARPLSGKELAKKPWMNFRDRALWEVEFDDKGNTNNFYYFNKDLPSEWWTPPIGDDGKMCETNSSNESCFVQWNPQKTPPLHHRHPPTPLPPTAPLPR